MDKRGDIIFSWVVGLILLAISLAILMLFLVNLDGRDTIDDQVCHQSVVYRASLPKIIEDYIPLKCKTKKYCITNRLMGMNCSEFSGDKNVVKVRVNDEEDIEKLYAQEIIKCWSMLGEGKVSLFTQAISKTYGIGTIYPTCVICSRIALDVESINKSKIDLAEVNVFEYMLTHKVPGKSVSYYEYIMGEDGAKLGVNELMNLKPVDAKDNIVKGLEEVVNKADLVESSEKIFQSRENAILFTQISAPEQWGSAKNILGTMLGVTVAGHALMPTSTMKKVDLGLLKVCTSGGWIGPLICGGLVAFGAIFQQSEVAKNRAIAATYCGNIFVGTEARSGCSVVRTVEYDANEINKYCQVIESIA